MSPYEELGVAVTATRAEVRRAYLELARRHHPDRFAVRSPREQRAAAERMAKINAAWSVLNDPGRRAEYDARRGEPTTVDARGHVRTPDDHWTPYSDQDPDIDPRLLDDTPSGAPTLKRIFTFVPALFFASGVVSVGFGSFMGFAPILAVGLGLLFLSVVSFVLVPVMAMVNSSRAELD